MPLLKNPPHYITIGENRLPLIATRNHRSKRLILRFDAKMECVKLTVPRGVSAAQALAFAESRRDWLARQINNHPKFPLEDGMELPLWGKRVTLAHVGGRGVVTAAPGLLLIPGERDFLARRTRDFIQKETKKRIICLAQGSAHKLGVSIKSVSLRDTTSRWGSCSASGALSFCWRLAFAPLEVMEYVVHHEVAHLKHHNHSAKFWQTVAFLCPDYDRHEKWLSAHGQTLWYYD